MDAQSFAPVLGAPSVPTHSRNLCLRENTSKLLESLPWNSSTWIQNGHTSILVHRSYNENPIPEDHKHNNLLEASCILTCFNLNCVRAELAAITHAPTQAGADSGSTVDPAAPLRQYKRLVEVVRHQTGSRSSTTITSAFDIGHREAGRKDSCGTGGNVSTLCKEGRLKEAIEILDLMDKRGIKAFSDTYVSLLQGCIKTKALTEGKKVHAHMIKSGFKPTIFLGNTLVNMYAKCGNVVDARKVFDKMPERNVFTWTIMITGYAKHGYTEEAFELFWKMQGEGVKPNEATVVSILNACASLGALEQGKQIHAYILKNGFESNLFVGNSLIDMYAKCGNIKYARQMFDKMPEQDVISWNTIISGYANHEHAEEALKLFGQMKQKGVKPDKLTFVSILKVCALLGALEEGKQIHAYIIKSGLVSNVFVGSTLVDMYAKCGSIENARQVFDEMSERDVVTWNVMIAGYAQHGHVGEAFIFFQKMQQMGVKPDAVTFLSILKVCASPGTLEQGKEIHAQIIVSGFESAVSVRNALIDMYAKCGSMECARQVFDKMPKQNVVTWTAIIAGYGQHGHAKEAFKLFWRMEQEGVKPNKVTFVIILKVCASLAALEQGKQIHVYIIKNGFESDAFVRSALVDMYAKCGSIEHARQVFDKSPERDVVLWTAMIAGYAQHGHGKEALQLFEQMQGEGLKLHHITFVGLLSACSHGGLVKEGWHYFDSMSREHGIAPTMEHYACMVDLLGRAGRLDEAEAFVRRMPFQPSSVVWIALLGACRIYGDVELARCAAESILELEPQNTAAFVLLSNIYAAAGRWEDKAKMIRIMEDR